MEVALFVEGGMSMPAARLTQSPLATIWEHLATVVGFEQGFSSVVPISKKHLVAMDPAKPTMSGASEGLDQLLARKLAAKPFDAAVIAWDLIPAWNPSGHYCRWQETLDLYQLLADSTVLPLPWVEAAQRRRDGLRSRPLPAHRKGPHRVGPYEVVAVCMGPMFEAALLQDEQHVLRALGISRRPRGWPTRAWGSPTVRPDQDLLRPIIRSLRAGPRKQRARVAKLIGADERNKDPWMEYLLRRMLDDEAARDTLLEHPMSRRLAECLA